MTEVTDTLAPKKEIFAWAMYDFANSGYTTVVLTAVYNAYFVGVIAGSMSNGAGTLLWTIATSIANICVLVGQPVIGAIADHRASKKQFLLITTLGCVVATALLSIAGPGEIVLAMVLLILSNIMFASGEALVAAFLPELAPSRDMGRISGYGWTVGYLGGLLVLGLCLTYVTWAQGQGQEATQYVPVTLWITAVAFAAGAIPTFIWLRERAQPLDLIPGTGYFSEAFGRLRQTLSHARHYRDLFRFLIALAVFYCGIHTVIVLAAVYAHEVMGFTTQDSIMLILVVNITAAIGAFVFGYVQDKLGSVRTLVLTLLIWILALVFAYFTETRSMFWVVANLVGMALGSSQSAGRALVGQFAPPGRAGEFFGLWSFATRMAAIVGPLSYGLVTFATHGNHRIALAVTTIFFISGIALVLTISEVRGKTAALQPVTVRDTPQSEVAS